MCGIYPDAGVKSAGDQISSTYEGRHVTLTEEELKHPSQTYGWVTKGDPVIFCLAGTETSFGIGVGVAMTGNSQLAAPATSDLITVDTEGIWVQNVVATDDDGPSDVIPGDALYISTAVPGCIISKIANPTTNIPFGYALGFVTGDSDGDIAVKVHSYREIPDYLEFAGGKIAINSWGAVIEEGYYLYMNDDFSAYVASLSSGNLDLSGNTAVNMRVSGPGEVFTIEATFCTIYPKTNFPQGIDLNSTGDIRLSRRTAGSPAGDEAEIWYDIDLDKLKFRTAVGVEIVTSA